MCDDTVGTSHSSHHHATHLPLLSTLWRIRKLTPPSSPRCSTAAAKNLQLPLCASGPPTVSRIVNHCLMRACHITTNPTRARLIPRSLSFLAPPLLEGCGHPRSLPRHLQHHGPQQRQRAQVYRQEVGVLTTGQTLDSRAGVSTGGRCIDHSLQGRHIDNRACVSTGGVHIDSKAGVSTTGKVY